MNIIKVTYQYTRHIRTPTCGGMDSEYSHSEVDVNSRSYVVPDDHERWKRHVQVDIESSFKPDGAFKIISIDQGEKIYGIFSNIQFRI